MRRHVTTAVAGVLVAMFVTPVAVFARSAKIDICHYEEETGLYWQISVSERSLEKHLHHGDVVVDGLDHDCESLNVEPVDPQLSRVVVAPASVPANGSSYAAVTVTLKDRQGQPLPARDVALSVTVPEARLTPAWGTTDAHGEFVSALSSTWATSTTVTAVADPLTGHSVELEDHPEVSLVTPFTAGTVVTFQGAVSTIDVGDLNGDGMLDVVGSTMSLGDQSVPRINVFIGDDSWGPASTIGQFVVDHPGIVNPAHLGVGDLEGDSRLEVVFVNLHEEEVSVLRDVWSLAPELSSFSMYGRSMNSTQLAISDIDGDALLDVAVANDAVPVGDTYMGNASVLFGDGVWDEDISNLRVLDLVAGWNPRGIGIGDMDGDGDADLAVANFDQFNGTNGSVTLFLGNLSHAGYSLVHSSQGDFSTISQPNSVAISDVNGDGYEDVLTANEGGAVGELNYPHVSVLLSDGNGSISATESPATSGPAFSIDTADFNGDGVLDLVTADSFSNSVSLLVGDGAGSFTALGPVLGFSMAPRSVVVADFNGDAVLDFAIAGERWNEEDSVFESDLHVLLGLEP